MLWAVRGFLICAVLMTVTALKAATPDELQCMDVNNRQRADETIVACTHLLTDGRHNKALVLRNRCGAYLTKSDFDSALIDCNQALAEDPGSAMSYIRRGHIYQAERDLDHAIADYDDAIRLDPKSMYAYRDRAGAYYYKHDYARAIADYNKAIQFNANDALSLYWRGKAKQKSGDIAGGEADMVAAQKINPQIAN